MKYETQNQIEQYKSALFHVHKLGLSSGVDYYIDRIAELREELK